jgi:hypothetical protein
MRAGSVRAARMSASIVNSDPEDSGSFIAEIQVRSLMWMLAKRIHSSCPDP